MLKTSPALPNGCISDLTFDAFLAEELDKSRERDLQGHLEVCGACSSRRQRLQREAAGYRARPDYAEPLARVHRSLTRRRKRSYFVRFGSMAAALGVLLVWSMREPVATERLKGSSSIGFYVRRGEQVFRGRPGELVHPGDQLRFTWRSPHAAYLAILSIDGRRMVSTYYPPPGPQSPWPAADSEVGLPGAVELDAVLGDETVFVLSCERAPDLPQLQRELTARGSLSAPSSCRLEQLGLRKVARQ